MIRMIDNKILFLDKERRVMSGEKCCCGEGCPECESKTLGTFNPSPSQPCWDLSEFHGDGVGTPCAFWRLIAIDGCTESHKGDINKNGKLVDLPLTYCTESTGRIELQQGCKDAENRGAWAYPCDGSEPEEDIESIEYEFTQYGFINSGRNGNFYCYSNPALFAGSPWTKTGLLSMRLNWENDSNCAHYNDNVQSATAQITINIIKNKTLVIEWDGMAERQDTGFEYMSLSVDGDEIGRASSPGGDLGCEGGNGKVISIPDSTHSIDLEAGEHILFIDATTGDDLFHVNAWYSFTINLI